MTDARRISIQSSLTSEDTDVALRVQFIRQNSSADNSSLPIASSLVVARMLRSASPRTSSP